MEKLREWTKEEKKDHGDTYKAMNILFCILGLKEFNRVSTCKIANEIWNCNDPTFWEKNKGKGIS